MPHLYFWKSAKWVQVVLSRLHASRVSIAVRLRVHQLRERVNLLGVAAKQVRNKVSEVIGRQRRQLDILHPSGCADRLQLAHERMGGGDLVIAESADNEEIAEIGAAQQVFQQVERRRIEPL